MPWVSPTGRAYLNTLTERLASENFAGSDGQLPELLREVAEDQVAAGKLHLALQLRRAAQLLETQLAGGGRR